MWLPRAAFWCLPAPRLLDVWTVLEPILDPTCNVCFVGTCAALLQQSAARPKPPEADVVDAGVSDLLSIERRLPH